MVPNEDPHDARALRSAEATLARVERSVDAALASRASPVIVVLGHQGEAVRQRLAGRKVTFVEVPMPQLTDVLRGGSVDAIAVIDPFRARSLGDGSAVKVADFLAELHDPSPLAFWIARAEWARANRPVVEAYRRALAAALVFIAANPDETRDIGAKYLHGQRVARFSTWSLALTPEDLVYEAGIETELGLLREKFDAQAAVLK